MMPTLQFRLLQHPALTPKSQKPIKLTQQSKLKFNQEIKRITREELTEIKRW
jgi:DNA-directed RNA polymerase specialized sigma54-like protein